MLIKKPSDIPSSEITPKSAYLNRRKFLAGAALAGAAAATGVAFRDLADPPTTALANAKIDGLQKSPFSTTEKETPYKTSPTTTTSTNFPPTSTSPRLSPRISKLAPGPSPSTAWSRKSKPSTSMPS